MTDCTNSCGTGSGTYPLPNDPDNNSILTATPAFGGIDVSWTYPTTNPHAVSYVILYRGILPDFNSAIQIAKVSGDQYYDKSTSPQLIVYYYWIRIVSINGTVGELIGPASATAKPTIEVVLEQLAGRIDSGVLAQTLKAEIDKITLNYQTLLTEVNDRIAANTALSNAMAQLQSGIATTQAYIGTEITQRQDGEAALVGQINTLSALNSANAAAIQQEQSARVDADGALAQDISTLFATSTTNTAAILTEQEARISADDALTTSIATVLANATSNTAAITAESVARADADSVMAEQISSLLATTAANAAAITAEETARATEDSANASSITTLEATVTSNHTAAMDAANAAQTAANTANTALSNIASDSILSPSEKPAAVKEYNLLINEQAGITAQGTLFDITTEKTAYTTALTALTTYLNALTGWDTIPGSDVAIVGTTFRTNFSDVYTARQNLLNAIYAKAKTLADGAQTTANNVSSTLQTNYYTKTQTDSAISGAVTTAQSTFESSIASVQTTLQTNISTVAETVTAIGALYTATVNVNGLIGGFGIYNDGTTVQAGFDVDEFWIGSTQDNKRKPFIISGGVVYIDQAAIANASISLAKIDTANILSLSAIKANMGTITAGKMQSVDNKFIIDLDNKYIRIEV
jgi:hypothetical protein